MTKKWG